MTDSKRRSLIGEALKAREFSFSPMSGFAVGAALLGADGKIYHGCNIECAGMTPSNCAERTAFFKAVSEGCMDFEAIAIVGGPKDMPLTEYCPPCGVCRQVMAQFCRLDTFPVIMAIDEEHWEECTLGELLPKAFQRYNPNMGS